MARLIAVDVSGGYMAEMKRYDAVLIGTGSGLEIVRAIVAGNPDAKVAVIDRDEPGGICLTRGCIPSKILLYPAELVRIIGHAPEFGIQAELGEISFPVIMKRMRTLIGRDMAQIAASLVASKNIDYYRDIAQFIGPKILKVGHEILGSDLILLCTGSRPAIPPIPGLKETGYLTSDTLLRLDRLPESIMIVGGGYIAAEYGHFFAAMGSDVTIIGRNPRFLPQCEPEVSALVRRELERHMTVLTNHEVTSVAGTAPGAKTITAVDRTTKSVKDIHAEEILVATGRAPNTDMLRPEIGGVKVDEKGWIVVDGHRETSQPGVYAFGDATGMHMFKHMANYEAKVVYYNAVLREEMMADDDIVPFAVFTEPETAGVGLREAGAIAVHGEENTSIGFYHYEDTAKGLAIGAKDCFVKVIVEAGTNRILGAHIAGPNASVLIQEIITLMTAKEPALASDIAESIHIHPAMSEVVDRACSNLMSVADYRHIMEGHLKLLPGRQ